METEAIADEIIMLVQQLLTAAGPEWTMQFLQAGLEEAGMVQGQQMGQGQQTSQAGIGGVEQLGARMKQRA
jgi:hypothetical protein